MIKVIAFDLVGVLVCEKDIKLNAYEEKLERLFGPNKNDTDYLKKAKSIIDNTNIVDYTKNIINKLYEVKDKSIINRLKHKYPNIKLIVATNHLSYVNNFIEDNINVDDIIISANINKIKPNKDFYEYILKKYSIKPNELLFLDDSIKNIEGADKLGINTIIVNKDTNIFDEICKII